MGTLLYFDTTKSTVRNEGLRKATDEITVMADEGKVDGVIIGGVKDGKIVYESTQGTDRFLVWSFATRLIERIGRR